MYAFTVKAVCKGGMDERKLGKWEYHLTLLGDGQLCVCLASATNKTAVYMIANSLQWKMNT